MDHEAIAHAYETKHMFKERALEYGYLTSNSELEPPNHPFTNN